MLADMKMYLNASEVAKLLGVDRSTVTRWIKQRVITGAIQQEATLQWRIPLAAYQRLLKRGQQ
jgi:predicted site-specific integrase-resolvase